MWKLLYVSLTVFDLGNSSNEFFYKILKLSL